MLHRYFFHKLRYLMCGLGLGLMMGLPITALAVTVQINSPLDGAVIKADNTIVSGVASALGGGGQGIDLMLVLDDSGSLQNTDPTRERFEATRQLLSSFGPNANVYIGMVFFSDNAQVAVPLRDVSTARSAINGAIIAHQMPNGYTAIGDGIRTASQELITNGRANTSKVILVFTDGIETIGSQPEVAAADALNQGHVVHVVGLFPAAGSLFFTGADPAESQRIAQAGGGQYFLATDPQQLIPLFRAAKIVEIDHVTVTNVTTGKPANSVSLNTGNFTAPGVGLVVGQNVLKAVATDTDGATAEDSVTVTVEPICPDDSNPVCPCPNPSNPSCPKVRVKPGPQVIMAGFDPMLIDFGDAETAFKIMAVVREGSASIRQVALKANTEAINLFAPSMILEGQLKNGDKVYSLKYVLPRETAYRLKGNPLPNLFGSKPGEYHIIAIDEAQEIHAFPDLNMGNNPDVMVHALTQAPPYTTRGIRRHRPQVIMAGFDPMVLDFGDDSFKIKAIVRAGKTSIQNVTLQNGSATLRLAMNREEDIGNGDIMYSAEYTFARGSLPIGSLRDLFGTLAPNEYVVEVIDQAQQKHAFPGLEVCGGRGCPEYK